MKPAEAALASGWQARLELGYDAVGGQTRLRHRRHSGPLAVQRPFFPEGPALCQTVVLHPPGGVAGGDRLEIAISVAVNAAAQLTTPGAGKWYRGFGREATQEIGITIADGGLCEWLPQENIVFDGARARMALKVSLARNAAFCGWDLTCLGRPAAQAPFREGTLMQRLLLRSDGRELFREQAVIDAGDARLNARAVLAGCCGYGTLVAIGAAPIERERYARAQALALSQPQAGVTALGNMIVGRWVGDDLEQGRAWFCALWGLLRPWYAGRMALVPRIWST